MANELLKSSAIAEDEEMEVEKRVQSTYDRYKGRFKFNLSDEIGVNNHDEKALGNIFADFYANMVGPIEDYLDSSKMRTLNATERREVLDDFVSRFRYIFIDRMKEQESTAWEMIDLATEAINSNDQDSLNRFEQDLARVFKKNLQERYWPVYFQIRKIWGGRNYDDKPSMVTMDTVRMFLEGIKEIPLRPRHELKDPYKDGVIIDKPGALGYLCHNNLFRAIKQGYKKKFKKKYKIVYNKLDMDNVLFEIFNRDSNQDTTFGEKLCHDKFDDVDAEANFDTSDDKQDSIAADRSGSEYEEVAKLLEMALRNVLALAKYKRSEHYALYARYANLLLKRTYKSEKIVSNIQLANEFGVDENTCNAYLCKFRKDIFNEYIKLKGEAQREELSLWSKSI